MGEAGSGKVRGSCAVEVVVFSRESLFISFQLNSTFSAVASVDRVSRVTMIGG